LNVHSIWLIFSAVLLILPAAGTTFANPAMKPLRIVFLGSSSTDGDTFPQLVRTALEDAGIRNVRAINAGVGGDVAEQLLARIERDVLTKKPTLVVVQSGVNDALQNVPKDRYERAMREIIGTLRKSGTEIVLLTPNIFAGAKEQDCQEGKAGYEAILHKLAGEHGLKIAEVNKLQRAAAIDGKAVVEADDVHPTYLGQRMIARAVLDAIGHAGAAVPERSRNAPLPGLVTSWRAREKGSTGPWITINLPEQVPVNQQWLDDLRGFAMSVSLTETLKPGTSIEATATIESDAAAKKIVTLGGDVLAVALNGTPVWKRAEFRGFHIGSQSIELELRVGEDEMLIESGPAFFVSVTDRPLDEE